MAAAAGRPLAAERPGRETAIFGPCVAKRASSVATLARWYVVRAGMEKAIVWDLPRENREAVEVAQQMGFNPQRVMLRLTRGSLNWNKQLVFAIAAPELG